MSDLNERLTNAKDDPAAGYFGTLCGFALAKIQAQEADLTEARRLLDEARTTLVGIAGATARAWELPRSEFIDEFLPWAQSRARDAAAKIAAPVPAQPAAFPTVQSGESVIPEMRGYLMECCDCGLVHSIDFDVIRTVEHMPDGSFSYETVADDSLRIEMRVSRASGEKEQPATVPEAVAHAVHILRKHNEWRRGADNNHWQSVPYSPSELGRAIDTVCDATHDVQHDVLKRATDYARDLVTWLHRDHYADHKTFQPFDDLIGLLSQIDNMICGWKEPKIALPEAVTKDAERYRWLRSQSQQGVVKAFLPLTRCHYVVVNESAYDYPVFDEAVDAAILSATDDEVK